MKWFIKPILVVCLCFVLLWKFTESAPSDIRYDEELANRIRSRIIYPNNSDVDFSLPTLSPPQNDEIRTSIVDVYNNGDILSKFNISLDDVLRKAKAYDPGTSNTLTDRPIQIPTPNTSTDNKDAVVPYNSSKELFTEIFKRKIEHSVGRNGSKQDQSSAAVHEMAIYPVCSKNNKTLWLEENTAKLFFSANIYEKLTPDMYVHSAQLRLLQVSNHKLDKSTATDCSEPDELIRVTVSVNVKKNNGELQKRVCNSFITKRYDNGWINIDVKQVIKFWQKAYKVNANNKGSIADPLLLVDVENQDRVQLKAGLFFEPTDCEAASAIPWNLYGVELRDTFGTPPGVPKYPRLDLQWGRKESVHPYRHHYDNCHKSHYRNFTTQFDISTIINQLQLHQNRSTTT